MQPSHLLRHDMEYHRATLLREAAYARLVRLAHSETASLRQCWFARRYQRSIRLLWHQVTLRKQPRAVASQSILASALPTACCGACSC
jgi:hypothetical protein